MKTPCTFLLVIALGGTLSAQPTFIRTYSTLPYAWGVAATSTGGLVVTGNYSDTACYLLRLDREGEVSWMKRYAGLGNSGGGSELNPCVLISSMPWQWRPMASWSWSVPRMARFPASVP